MQTWKCQQGDDWKIIIIHEVEGVKNHYLEYINETDLPKQFTKMTSIQAKSDLLRLALLYRHGGVWMDINIILFSKLENFCLKESDVK